MTNGRVWTVRFGYLGYVVLWCNICRCSLRMEPIYDPGDGYLPPNTPRQCPHAPLFLVDPCLPCGYLRVLRRAVLPPPDPGATHEV